MNKDIELLPKDKVEAYIDGLNQLRNICLMLPADASTVSISRLQNILFENTIGLCATTAANKQKT